MIRAYKWVSSKIFSSPPNNNNNNESSSPPSTENTPDPLTFSSGEYSPSEISIIQNLDLPMHVVFNKLEKIENFRKNLKFKRKLSYAKALSDVKELRKCWFYKDFDTLSSSELKSSIDFGEFLKISQQQQQKQKQGNMGRLSEENNMMNEGNEHEHEELWKTLDFEKNTDVLSQSLMGFKTTGKTKIQFIITEIEQNPNSLFTKIKNNLITKIGKKSKLIGNFGVFHTALLFGGLKIEWNESSICLPREYKSKAILCVDLHEVVEEEEYKKIVKALTKRIIYWNRSYYFSRTDYNCQNFVNDILKEIGLENKLKELPDPIKKFIEKISSSYNPDMSVEFNEEFCEKFKLKKKIKKFKTHKELDLFVLELQKIDPFFHMTFKDYAFILKSFDRAFWLSNYREKNCINEPLENCPFCSPKMSGSFSKEPKKRLPKI